MVHGMGSQDGGRKVPDDVVLPATQVNSLDNHFDLGRALRPTKETIWLLQRSSPRLARSMKRQQAQYSPGRRLYKAHSHLDHDMPVNIQGGPVSRSGLQKPRLPSSRDTTASRLCMCRDGNREPQ